MCKKILTLFTVSFTVAFLSLSVTSCKSKPKDADIKANVDKSIAAVPYLSGINTEVKDGVVTLSGQVKDESEKLGAEGAAKSAYGVKSVVNNITVAPPLAAPVQITPDDPLKVSVDSTIKNYPGVNATITDGVVTLTGNIKRSDLQKLMMALNTLKPRKIENKLTIN